MKILHTSDWHLGHTLYEHDRTEEMRAFAVQLCDIVRHEQPDALLVCGDVYDRAAPPVAAHELYVDTLLRLRSECPSMQLVVTAGNHDSKASLQVEGRIWNQLGMRIVGQPERTADGEVDWERFIVAVEGKGYIIAVPHIYEQNYPSDNPDLPREQRKQAFFKHLADMVAERNVDGLPVVMMAHLWAEGAQGSNNPVGGLESTLIGDMAAADSGVDYLALGHIHQVQRVSDAPVAWYCGSPLPTSFDSGGQHGLLKVDVQHHGPVAVEHIDIANPMPLLTLPAEPSSFDEAINELAMIDSDQAGYLRLNLLRDGSRPADYVERIMHAIEGKQLNYCTIALTDPPETPLPDTSPTLITFSEMQTKSPADIAAMHFAHVNTGGTLPDDWRQMIEELTNEPEP